MRFQLNIDKLMFETDGVWDMPLLEAAQTTFTGAEEVIPFNYAITERQPQNKGVHFFLDDYQFERVWTCPEKYGEILKRFKFVLTPDFSLYRNYPKIMQMFNHYRKQWCGCFFQSLGIDVIATACWSDEDSFEWCFDGMPQDTAVALSSVGTQMNKLAKRLFLAGYEKMKEKLHPRQILFYGQIPEELKKEELVKIASFSEERFRR